MGSIDTYPPLFSSTSNAVLGYVEVTANQGSITTEIDVTGLVVTVNVPNGRRIRVSALTLPGSTVADDRIEGRLYEDGVRKTSYVNSVNTTSDTTTICPMYVGTPSAGTHTYKMTMLRAAGTGTVTNNAGVGFPSFLLVEDITGGTGGPGAIQLAYGEFQTDSADIGAGATTITDMSKTVSVPSGRKLRVNFESEIIGITAATGHFVDIYDNGVWAGRIGISEALGANVRDWMSGNVIVSPTAGTHTYSVVVTRYTGTGFIRFEGSGATKRSLSVDDITGTNAPGALQPSSQTLAYVETATPQTIGATATETDLTGLSVTISVPDGRRIRLSAQVTAQAGTASDRIVGYFKEGSTYLGRWGQFDAQQNGGYEQMDGSIVITPTAGTHTYKLTIQRYTGAGSLATDSASDRKAFFLVEDVTGNTPAYPAVNVPVGQLAYATATAAQSGIGGTETDLAGMSVNIAVPAGRVVRISGRTSLSSPTVANDEFALWTVVDGTHVMVSARRNPNIGDFLDIQTSYVFSPSAGSHTIKFTLQRTTGTGTVSTNIGSDRVPYILVEDITPTPAATTGAPSSTLAYAEITANQAGITTEVDLTGLSVTVTVPAGRRIQVVASVMAVSTVSNDTFGFAIKEGATQLQYGQFVTPGVSVSGQRSVILSPTPGTHTYKVTGLRAAGTGSFTVQGSATQPSFILVEDITSSTYTYSQPGVLPVNSTSLPSSPSTGAMVYEVDTGATKIWNGTSWQIFGQGASTTLGYAQVTASQASITTATDITGLSVTVNVPAGRRIRISASIFLASTVSTDGVRIMLMEGATQLQLRDQVVGTAGPQTGLDATIVITPTAGSHTYKVQGARWTGSGTASNIADPTYPSWILVEDITGTNSPAPAVSVPVGQIGYAEITSTYTIGAGGGEADIVGLSVNFTVPAGRVIRATGFAHLRSSVATDTVYLRLKDGANSIGGGFAYINELAASPNTPMVQAVYSPSAGAHTIQLRGARQAGTGSLSVYAAAGEVSYLLIEDITPTPASATGAPSSTLGYSEVTANQGSITTEVDLTGLVSTVTLPAGRRIRVTGRALARSTVASDEIILRTYQDGVQIQAVATTVPNSGRDEELIIPVVISPAAGSHTYKLTMARNTGTGTIQMTAGAAFNAYILVEDITGSVWAQGSQVTMGLVASEAWTQYTPAWTSSGTAPVIGNGSLLGRYIKIGRTVIGAIYFAAGSTTTFGTGNYFWSLPFAPSNSLFAYQIIGSGKGYSSGSNLNALATINANTQTVRLAYSATWPTGAETLVGQLNPWTWATGNDITIQFTYESAT